MFSGLAKAYHWTPQQVKEMTFSEITLASSGGEGEASFPDAPTAEELRRFKALHVDPS